jgi:hypothetical protein
MNTDFGRTIGFVGPISGSAGVLAIASTLGQYAEIHRGTTMTGPFQETAGMASMAPLTLIGSSANSFGAINIGGGIRGTSGTVSFIGGDSLPDLVLAGQTEAGVANGGPLYIVSGVALRDLIGSVHVADSSHYTALKPDFVQIIGQIPPPGGSAWLGYSQGCLIPDLNGDGVGDFAIGENTTTVATSRVVVFY